MNSDPPRAAASQPATDRAYDEVRRHQSAAKRLARASIQLVVAGVVAGACLGVVVLFTLHPGDYMQFRLTATSRTFLAFGEVGAVVWLFVLALVGGKALAHTVSASRMANALFVDPAQRRELDSLSGGVLGDHARGVAPALLAWVLLCVAALAAVAVRGIRAAAAPPPPPFGAPAVAVAPPPLPTGIERPTDAPCSLTGTVVASAPGTVFVPLYLPGADREFAVLTDGRYDLQLARSPAHPIVDVTTRAVKLRALGRSSDVRLFLHAPPAAAGNLTPGPATVWKVDVVDAPGLMLRPTSVFAGLVYKLIPTHRTTACGDVVLAAAPPVDAKAKGTPATFVAGKTFVLRASPTGEPVADLSTHTVDQRAAFVAAGVPDDPVVAVLQRASGMAQVVVTARDGAKLTGWVPSDVVLSSTAAPVASASTSAAPPAPSVRRPRAAFANGDWLRCAADVPLVVVQRDVVAEVGGVVSAGACIEVHTRMPQLSIVALRGAGLRTAADAYLQVPTVALDKCRALTSAELADPDDACRGPASDARDED